MGIGFVILFWFFIFAMAGGLYLVLHFLAKENEGFADLKKAFLALFGLAMLSAVCLVIFAVGNVCLNYFYPSRIFTKNFGFEPTADVRIIEGSSFWTPFGYSTHLKFQASEETIGRIVTGNFVEESKKHVNKSSSIEINDILEQPQSRYYIKSGGDVEIMVYDNQSKNAYFSFHTVD
jgi:hypothetical protein